MTSIILHIEYLLQHGARIVLPGIGAFEESWVSAKIDENRGIILPPSRKINFNPNIKNIPDDDNSLLKSIARGEKISITEARLILNRESAVIRSSLEIDEEYEIGKIGLLTISPDNAIAFIPRLSEEEKAEAMGCPRAYLSESSSGSELEFDEATDSIPDALAQPEKNASESELPEGYYLKTLSKKNYYIPVNKIFARCAASIIVIAAIALSFIIPSSTMNDNEVKASMNPAESLASKSSCPANLRIDDPEYQCERSDEAQPEIEEIEKIVESPSGYYLIVATFPTKSEAGMFIKSRAGGHYSLQAIERNGLWRISAGHGDHSTLRTILNSSEFRAAFSEAWIWKVEP